MKAQVDYEPCFADVRDTWAGRWQALREFTRRWHGLTLGPVGAPSAQADAAIANLGCPAPPSLREWLVFAHELIDQNAWSILRDDFELKRIGRRAAITLLRQHEQDLVWAVKEADLGADDPPVCAYLQRFPNPRFVEGGQVAPSVTSFVLGHVAYFLRGKGGGFLTPVDAADSLCRDMRQAFTAHVCFGHLEIFESRNIIAMVFPDALEADEHRLLVEIWRPLSREALPRCLLAAAEQGGCFHGPLAAMI